MHQMLERMLVVTTGTDVYFIIIWWVGMKDQAKRGSKNLNHGWREITYVEMRKRITLPEEAVLWILW